MGIDQMKHFNGRKAKKYKFYCNLTLKKYTVQFSDAELEFNKKSYDLFDLVP